MGLGRFGGGAGVTRYLAREGAKVTVTDRCTEAELADPLLDLADVPFTRSFGGHRAEDFERADLVVPNPAVRPDHPLLEHARSKGARVVSAMGLFLEATTAQLVGITGTQGKSSTCHLLAQLLDATGRRVHLGGNFGGSLLDRIDHIGPNDVCVLELSSYQLEALDPGGRLAAVGITNILADHLERHGTHAAYVAAKLRIFDLLVERGISAVPGNDVRMPPARPGEQRLSLWGAAVARDEVPQSSQQDLLFLDDTHYRRGELLLGRLSDSPLLGTFQHTNLLLALGLANALGAAPEDLARSIPNLTGLEHRMQDLGNFQGVRVIDNGVSTTPDSTVSLLRSLPGTSVLIAGGKAKDLPIDELRDEIAAKVDTLILFGDTADDWSGQLQGRRATLTAPSVEEAVHLGLTLAARGDTLCFSPAAASFDAFANFRERAKTFRAALHARTQEASQ